MKKIWFAFACFLITSCGQRTAPGAVLFSAPPPRPMLSTQQRGNLTESDIAFLIQRGDQEYANGNYFAAKNYYYEVLLAVPNPNVYVILSYGSCLLNLGLYENAIEIFNRALEKDPYNEYARKNIAICQYFIAKEFESQRQFQEDQERIKRENLQNLAGSFAELGEAAQKNEKTKNLAAPLATMSKMTLEYQKVEDIIANMDSLGGTLNRQNAFAILNLLGDVAQKNRSNNKLANSLSSLNKIAKDYQRAHNIIVNYSPDDVLNEQNMALILASLSEMAKKNRNNEKLNSALYSLSKIANEYKRAQNFNSPNEMLNEQNLITILNSLNEIAQEYQK